MVEGGMKCVKYVIFAFNLIFFLAGLGLIIGGAIIQMKFSAYLVFTGGFGSAAILIMVVGGVIFVIGFFGCCGAYKENYCMMITYSVLLGVIFVLEISAAITAYVVKDKLRTYFESGLRDGMKAEQKEVKDTWDKIHGLFNCCGVISYQDWNSTSRNVPDSCCSHKKTDEKTGITAVAKDCGKEMAGKSKEVASKEIYTQGCLDGFEQLVKNNIVIIAGVGAGLALIQLVGIILACCLARSIKKDYDYDDY